jgi:hypothetical protein
MRGLVLSFTVRKDGDDIVLETPREAGARLEWSFSNITAGSFTWRNREEVPPRGWSTRQTFSAVRARPRS